MNRAIFLDRDGVINLKAPEGEYITRWEDMQFLPGVADAIRQFNQAGFQVIVISNQRCVAKGLITIRDLESMHIRMCDALAASGATIDAVYYCPHENQPPCGCRKPAPGMLIEAARAHEIDLAASWMIGDSAADVEAGRRAGCRTARIQHSRASQGDAELVAPSLLEVVAPILRTEKLIEHSEIPTRV